MHAENKPAQIAGDNSLQRKFLDAFAVAAPASIVSDGERVRVAYVTGPWGECQRGWQHRDATCVQVAPVEGFGHVVDSHTCKYVPEPISRRQCRPSTASMHLPGYDDLAMSVEIPANSLLATCFGRGLYNATSRGCTCD